jgi:hypothetical protein
MVRRTLSKHSCGNIQKEGPWKQPRKYAGSRQCLTYIGVVSGPNLCWRTSNLFFNYYNFPVPVEADGKIVPRS